MVVPFLGKMLCFIVDEVERPLEYPIVVLEAVTAAACRIVEGLVGSRVFFLTVRVEDGILDLAVVVPICCFGTVDTCLSCERAAAAFFEVMVAGLLVASGSRGSLEDLLGASLGFCFRSCCTLSFRMVSSMVSSPGNSGTLIPSKGILSTSL